MSVIKLSAIVIFAAVMFGAASFLQACPNCKDGFAQDTKQAQIGESYSWSVLFMLVMMTAVAGGGALKIAYHLKKSQKDN